MTSATYKISALPVVTPAAASVVEHQTGTLSGQATLDVLFEAMGVFTGSGAPEGVVAAATGSIYLNSAGGTSTTLYVKQSSPTATTGWVGK